LGKAIGASVLLEPEEEIMEDIVWDKVGDHRRAYHRRVEANGISGWDY